MDLNGKTILPQPDLTNIKSVAIPNLNTAHPKNFKSLLAKKPPTGLNEKSGWF
jgi:hypothetical protein